MTDRALPHNLDAERAVLGAVMLHNAAIDTALELVYPVDFYREHHRRIFEAMLRLNERREPIDFISLREALSVSRELEAIGGPAYLAGLVDGLPLGINVAHYAKLIRDKAVLREIIYAAQRALERAYEASDDASVVLDAVQQDVFGIAAHATQQGLVPAPELAHELIPVLDGILARRGPITGVPSGLTDLDYLTCGWQKGDLVLIAARPSMGKTALALNAAWHAATMPEPAKVGIFSLEMSRVQLGLRLIGTAAQVNGHRMRTGQIWDAEFPRLTDALSALRESHLHIDDGMSITIHQMRAKARKMKAQIGLDLVIVDYLQLMESTRRGDNRTTEIGMISRELKGLARDLDVPVVALSQLSRAPETRSEKRPQLSDLRDSGALEQDADVVVFLYRDEVYNSDTADRGVAELCVAKQRNGPLGTAKVLYQPELMRFANLTERHGVHV